MKHLIIKSFLFSASLSKVHRTFFTLALGAMLLTGCDPDAMFDINDTIPTTPETSDVYNTSWKNNRTVWQCPVADIKNVNPRRGRFGRDAAHWLRKRNYIMKRLDTSEQTD